jgi:DNA-binding SARP family transcriptional activator
MDFRILGPLEVENGGRPVELGGARQRALLAILLLHRREVVTADRLIEDLYRGEPPATAAKSLQAHVSRLRRALGPANCLQTRAGGYVLEVGLDEVDADRLVQLLAEGRRALSADDPVVASESLGAALRLWRGPPLVDVAYEAFAQDEIARLEELRLQCLEGRLEADLALGGHSAVVSELERLVAEYPLRERLRSQLMLALYRCGRQAEALDVYQEARHVLVDELGIEPARQLRELHQAILRQDTALDLATAAEPVVDRARSGFVGREAELAELVSGLDDAFAGRGRLVLLGGEPGIGKSRLAEELMVLAKARGARVLIGRCWEAGGAPAYWPWVQSLRTYFREAAPDALRAQLGAGAADLSQMVPELRELLADLPEPRTLETEGARFRLFDATAEFLRKASDGRPILLVLDDLHAADAPSLLLWQFLAREIASTRILLLGVYRDVDPIPGWPLSAMLAEVTREPVTRRLSLGGLSEREIQEYVEQAAPEIASPELVSALHEETEGNPLFVGETVRLLALEGLVPESTGAGIAIPQSVRDVIGRRLGHLSEECNRVLALASVLGREFALDVLTRMRGVSEDELLETLDEALAARVVSDVPGVPGRLRFAHVLIRDTLYEGLTTARRVRLHRQAVDALEALHGEEPGPHFAELAHHSIAGRDFDNGLHYAQRAGDRALALLAHEEGARLYERALEALNLADRRDETVRCELLLSLGEAEARAGNTAAAKNAFSDAAKIARRLGLPHELARAAAGYGGRSIGARAGADDQLVPLLEAALAALADLDVELRARLLARLAGALREEPSRERRDVLSREAVELARRTENPAALAYALDGRAMSILAPDTIAEFHALGTEQSEVAERIGDSERVFFGQEHRFIAQITVGNISEAEAELDSMSRIADELRQPVQRWHVCAGRAMLSLAAGSLPEAEELIAQAFALGARAQPEMAIPVHGLQLHTLGDFRGRLEEVEPIIRDLVAEYPARVAFRCALAHVYARLGRMPEATRSLADLAEDDFSTLPFDSEWLYGMSLLAETSALLRDTGSAAVLRGLLSPWTAFNVANPPEGIRGSVSRYLGLLAMTMQSWRESAQHFEDALEMNERMGALPWLARTYRDYAEMLLLRDTPADRRRADDLLRVAGEIADELGMRLA